MSLRDRHRKWAEAKAGVVNKPVEEKVKATKKTTKKKETK